MALCFQACEYYSRAANSGHSKAAYNLAVLQLQRSGPLGLGTIPKGSKPKQPGGAFDWREPQALLEQAANGGMVEAMTELGVRMVEGGGKGRPEEGARWLQQAAAATPVRRILSWLVL